MQKILNCQYQMYIYSIEAVSAISLNNIREVEETDLKIGDTYHVGERVLILRGFINHEFYVSEDRCTNNYEIYYNVPVDEKTQIFRVPITYL
jgi:hypothetical protein